MYYYAEVYKAVSEGRQVLGVSKTPLRGKADNPGQLELQAPAPVTFNVFVCASTTSAP